MILLKGGIRENERICLGPKKVDKLGKSTMRSLWTDNILPTRAPQMNLIARKTSLWS